MTTTLDRKRRPARLRPEVDGLEDRTMLDGAVAAAAVAPGAEAYLTQLYIDTLDRLPSASELASAVNQVGRPGGVNAVATRLVTSQEYRAQTVETLYQDLLGRAPTGQELRFGINTLVGRGPKVLEALVLGSNEYFQTAGGGDNLLYVRSVYSEVLGVNPDESALFWVNLLDRGAVGRAQVAFQVLNSAPANQRIATEIFGQYLGTTPDAQVVDRAIAQLGAGVRPDRIIRDLVISTSYIAETSSVTDNIVETAVGAGSFTILAQALGAAGLVETLAAGGPFTVFAPTDAAFEALPPGTLDMLLLPENVGLLTDILLYHVVPGASFGAEVLSTGLLTTVQGDSVGASVSGGSVFVNTSEVVTPNIRATNGVIHVIDRVLLPPEQNIVEIAAASPDFSTLVAAVQAAGLVETLAGDGPFTVFAPTNEAFAALPAGTLDMLLLPENVGLLTDILLYHVVPGTLAVPPLAFTGLFDTAAGLPVLADNFHGQTFINDALVVAPNVVATNGVIHAIDLVLLPPDLGEEA